MWNKIFLKNILGWGFILWLIGYVLGFILFAFVPVWAIGWVITPIGIAITLWVLFKKIDEESLRGYATIAIGWTLIAIVCDFIFLVLFLHPAGGYYKVDVYLYYLLTFGLPIAVGRWKLRKRSHDIVSQ